MTVKDIIAQLLERGMAMQTFWGFYITVSLGLVVFFGNAKRTNRLPYVAALISVVFVAFAYVNCSGMTAISYQRNFLYCVLSSIETTTTEPKPNALDLQIARGFVEHARPDTPGEVRVFHVASDVAVLAAIWFLTLWRKDESQESKD